MARHFGNNGWWKGALPQHFTKKFNLTSRYFNAWLELLYAFIVWGLIYYTVGKMPYPAEDTTYRVVQGQICDQHFRKEDIQMVKKLMRGFPGGAVVENLPANAGDTGSGPGLGRSHMPRSN